MNGEWAVVVGDGLNALGVVRSLARGKVRVALLHRAHDAESAQTRLARVVERYGEQSELPGALLRLQTRLGGRPVLFLTEEEAVRVVSSARGHLQEPYRFRMAEHETMLALTHKEGVQQAAEQHGLPIPRAVRLQSERDLPRLAELRYPCVLKPGLKHDGYGNRFKKAYTVASADEALVLFREISPVLPDLIVQEWIVGGDDSIYFCLQYVLGQGQVAASFCGRKLRAWPPQVGGTASCMPADDASDELTALTSAFFGAVGFRGMGSMEYKRDTRDGRFYVVEPTVGRTDFQEEVATVNGVNIPLAAWCAEQGMAIPAVARPAPHIWREPTTDRWSEQQQGRHEAFSRHAVVDAYWRANDPAPWIRLQVGRVAQRLRSLR